MRTYVVRLAAALVAVIALLGGGAFALASASGSAPSASGTTFYGCVKLSGNPSVPWRGLFRVYEHSTKCPRGTFSIEWNQDANGKLTAQAAMSDSAVPTQLQYIGGTIKQTVAGHGATNLLQVMLPAGTYLVNADVKFDRSVSAATNGPDTYGYAALWTGAAASTAFTDFSQGAGTFTTGALPRLVNGSDVIDAVASGSHILVVPDGGEYLNLSGFAYNADESGGAYAGCVGVSGTNACTAGDLSQAGSVVVTGADLSVVKVG
jgi:hypothetical protein